VVSPAGVAWFSAASLLLPLALSEPVRAAGLALPAVLLARMCVVSRPCTAAAQPLSTAVDVPGSANSHAVIGIGTSMQCHQQEREFSSWGHC
jgi:hypothetical protein